MSENWKLIGTFTDKRDLLNGMCYEFIKYKYPLKHNNR